MFFIFWAAFMLNFTPMQTTSWANTKTSLCKLLKIWLWIETLWINEEVDVWVALRIFLEFDTQTSKLDWSFCSFWLVFDDFVKCTREFLKVSVSVESENYMLTTTGSNVVDFVFEIFAMSIITFYVWKNLSTMFFAYFVFQWRTILHVWVQVNKTMTTSSTFLGSAMVARFVTL